MATLGELRMLMNAAWSDSPVNVRGGLIAGAPAAAAGLLQIRLSPRQITDLTTTVALDNALKYLNTVPQAMLQGVAADVRDQWIDGATVVAYGCKSGYPTTNGRPPTAPSLQFDGANPPKAVSWNAGNPVASAIYGALQTRNYMQSDQVTMIMATENLLASARNLERSGTDPYDRLVEMIANLRL